MNSPSEQILEVGQECALTVETTSGDISISGWDKAQVSVYSPDGTPAIRQDGQKVEIKSKPGGAGDLTIRVPRYCDLALRSSSGDVTLQDLAGRISLQVISGDVKGFDLCGDLTARMVSGDLELRNCRLDRLEFDTVSGDSLIESQLSASGNYRVHTVSGDVRLLTPQNQPYTLYYHTLSGDFDQRLSGESKRKGWGKLEVTINGGGVAFSVHTTSGDLTVEAAEGVAEEQTERKEEEPITKHATRPLESPWVEAKPEPFAAEESTPSSSTGATSASARRMAILQAIEEGKISVSEGLAKLRELD